MNLPKKSAKEYNCNILTYFRYQGLTIEYSMIKLWSRPSVLPELFFHCLVLDSLKRSKNNFLYRVLRRRREQYIANNTLQWCNEMMDAITQRMKIQVFALAWHSLSQQGQNPTDKDTWQDFHKLESTMNFFIGLGRLSLVWFCHSGIWKNSRKSKLLIGINHSPKAETLCTCRGITSLP